MALVKCPNCEKEISDKALVCPGCGLKFDERIINPVLCEECGEVVSENRDVCSKCGCPVTKNQTDVSVPQKVELTSVNLPINKKFNKKHKFFIVAILAVLFLSFIIGFIVRNYQKEQYSSNYYSNLESATALMLVGAAKAESTGNLIKSVWYNTIYEEYDGVTDKYTRSNGYGFNDDFNDSLEALFSDQSFKDEILEIESNQETVSEIMKELQNPPEEYTEAYQAIKKLYDSYLELTNLGINPSGSLRTYSESFNNADSETLQNYEAMTLYLD